MKYFRLFASFASFVVIKKILFHGSVFPVVGFHGSFLLPTEHTEYTERILLLIVSVCFVCSVGNFNGLFF